MKLGKRLAQGVARDPEQRLSPAALRDGPRAADRGGAEVAGPRPVAVQREPTTVRVRGG